MFQPLTGKALDAVSNLGKVNIWEGSVRSGKTHSSLLAWIRFIIEAPPGDLAMVGRTERTLRNNTLSYMERILGKHMTVNRGDGIATICGRKVLLFGADNETSATKIQGLTLAGSYVDEAAVIPKSFWSMLHSRHSVPGARIFATCNPEGPRHHLYTDWLERSALWVKHDGSIEENGDANAVSLGVHRFSFVLDDNPSLSEDYKASQRNAHTGVFYKRFILGLWVTADGAIYDAFDEDRHVVRHEDLPTMQAVISLGLDYGTTNASRGILLGLGKGDDGINRLYAMDEWHPRQDLGSRRATDGELADDLQAWMSDRPRPRFTYVDPAAASFKTELTKRGMGPISNGDNDVVDGIRTISSLIATDRFRVSDACTGLISEAPSYVWDQKASEKGEDKPVKEDDHALDALRYAVFSPRHLWRNAIG